MTQRSCGTDGISGSFGTPRRCCRLLALLSAGGVTPVRPRFLFNNAYGIGNNPFRLRAVHKGNEWFAGEFGAGRPPLAELSAEYSAQHRSARWRRELRWKTTRRLRQAWKHWAATGQGIEIEL